MNKLMGFYELADMDIPSIPWKEYKGTEKLDPEYLWSIRSAVFQGDDLNLPRKIGIPAKEAVEFADNLLSKIHNEGLVIYYPYFLAKKSGTLNIDNSCVVIEAVNGDLWNLVTYSERDVTILITEKETVFDGDQNFLSVNEINSILSNIPQIKRTFRDDILEGKSVLLEWSFAQKSDLSKKPLGEEYLVFYEMRTLE